MYEYTIDRFEPVFNDFGDGYDDPDTEVHGDAHFREVAEKVKKLKRRYRNYFEYIKAIDIYTEYCELLVEKLGGMDEARLKFALDEVDDPIPAKPELKKTKLNKRLLSLGITESVDYRPADWTPPDPMRYANDIPEGEVVIIDYEDMSEKEIKKYGFDKISNQLSSETILNELNLLDKFYHNTHIIRKDAKKYKKNLIKMQRKQRQAAYDDDVTVGDILAETKKFKERAMFGERLNPNDGDNIVYRKGIHLTTDTMEELDVYESLREFGVKVSDNMLSKRAFRVVKRKDKKAKKNLKEIKRRKKKNNALAALTDGKFYTIEDMENDLCDMRYNRDGLVEF